ncbi:metal-dependent transcriptional regulator [Pseudonocardia sp.]|jgi:DtxR family Mn-dependent transcriptional regulator|uniref:metal-dependent transcriptional regulator n=1 Tax=Pseudonocardia sp. TaxID=60912 RepID=UPI0026236EF9|nr:metal-dependent transcriptional regulator [Pseudonocardia sp.]
MSRATEDYLKAVYHLGTHGDTVTTGMLAQELGVSSPSVSAMVKRLEDGELIDRSDGRGFRLTDAGEREALRVIRRHRLLETFLARALDVPWDEVHAEAELLEHALSDRLEERIDAALGHPTHDPHGDPIPPRDGPHSESWGVPLEAVPPGSRFRVERVSDRDSAALRHLGQLGVLPGALLDVEEPEPFGGPYWITVDGLRHPLGIPLTRLVHGRIEGTA